MAANDLIRTRRDALGLSMADVVRKLRPIWPGLSEGTISKTEAGARRVTLDEGRLWAYALNCSLDDLAAPMPKRYSPRRVRSKHKDETKG